MSLVRNLALALALGLSFACALPAHAKVKIRVNLNLYPQPTYGDPYYGSGDPYDSYGGYYNEGDPYPNEGAPYPNDGYDNGYSDPGYGYPVYPRAHRGFLCTASNIRGYQFEGKGFTREDASNAAWRACKEAGSRRCYRDPIETCERIRLRR